MKQIIKPYPFYGDESNVFGRIININFDEIDRENNTLNITLINNKMLEYDQLIFSSSWSSDKNIDYRPYFYEFISTTYNTKEIYKRYSNKDEWLCIKLYESLPDESIQGIIIEGEIIFSASPIERKNIVLVITDSMAPKELNDKIKLIYGITGNVYGDISKDRNAINDKINKILPTDINKLKSIIYNVGQANNSYLSINRNYGMFFDIGYTLAKSSTYTTRMEQSIDKYKLKRPKIIILSHWDLDHILGLVYAQNFIYNSIWIAPNIEELSYKEKSLSACRVCKYLMWRKVELILIDNTFNDKIVFQSQNKEITILKGKGGNGYTLNNNNFGLLLEAKGDQSMLFTGDVEYSKLPIQVIGNNYDYIITPHHAGNIGTPNVFADIAFIPVGQNNHGHPKLSHLRELFKRGSTIVFTCEFNSRELDL